MTYVMSFSLLSLVLGLVAVASNPSPYFAALGLVVVAGVGCGVLAGFGGPFLCLVLFLIYLGGMLVVFAYTTALAAEPFPEAWGSRTVLMYMVMYIMVVVGISSMVWGGWYGASWVPVDEIGGFSVFRGDISGVALMYSVGGWMVVVSAWVLLLTLFVVLELTRGLGWASLRAV
ncbi:NADH dehydrogenase subunit 6 (mitochondrion) [Pseudoliparis swirei]|uniref:NADH-ubiquinone oxidoreductase chain 6 n=1 Tax=Liparidae sp. YYS-2017 TaxID=2010393 RepID=A0A3G1IBG5_9TELE|nr:NADH dehydrogenase subunit 6 [Pseudoliparis swirei]ARX96598.1 NADH dehydrogenase subunit 6 [Liparidae sp. YYS-2017]UPH84340.1 NADH dehydrogenase subunit 6 [Pseudoliparis swirei]